jgi:voltage-gated potassium channel
MGLFSKFRGSTKERFVYLFVSLLLFILLPPFLIQHSLLKFALILLLVNLVGICTLIISKNSKIEKYDFVLFIALVAASVVDDSDNVPLEIIRSLVIFVFFTLTFRRLILYILKVEKVTASVIIGAISAYLLLGLSGAVLINLIQIIYPNSYNVAADYTSFYSMVYYSFVTLSTLGYGDIIPHSPQAKSIAMAIAVFGQLYMAILMAMLVGKFLNDLNNEKGNEDV